MLTSLLLASLQSPWAARDVTRQQDVVAAIDREDKGIRRPVVPQPWAATSFLVVPSSLGTKINRGRWQRVYGAGQIGGAGDAALQSATSTQRRRLNHLW